MTIIRRNIARSVTERLDTFSFVANNGALVARSEVRKPLSRIRIRRHCFTALAMVKTPPLTTANDDNEMENDGRRVDERKSTGETRFRTSDEIKTFPRRIFRADVARILARWFSRSSRAFRAQIAIASNQTYSPRETPQTTRGAIAVIRRSPCGHSDPAASRVCEYTSPIFVSPKRDFGEKFFKMTKFHEPCSHENISRNSFVHEHACIYSIVSTNINFDSQIGRG